MVLDNLYAHKCYEDRRLKVHAQVHYHLMPTHSSWRNQVDCWFSFLSRTACRTSVCQVDAGNVSYAFEVAR